MTHRIACVLNTIGLGGVPEVALQLLRQLPAAHYQAHIFVLKAADSEADARDAVRQRLAALGAELHIATLEGGRLGVIAELADWLQQRRIALLHTHSYRPNLYGRLAGALCRPDGLRIVAHYHNQYDDKWRKHPADLSLERHLARHSDALLAVSQSVRAHLADRLALPSERITLLANGIDHTRFQQLDRGAARAAYGIADDALAVGLVGRICAQKGVAEFVDAAASLAPRYPRVQFLIAGNAEDAKLSHHLASRIERQGLGAQIRLLGHQQPIEPLYAALDILAAPSRWEGFGLMLVEAMAAGVPIVASRVGAIPEVVAEGRTALLVPPQQPKALAEALQQLLDDPALRQRLGAAGPAHAARYGWSQAGQQLHQLYQQLLTPGATP